MTTKHPYLKEILKTTTKVALIAGATYFFAAPFVWGLTATVLNAMTAAEVAEIATLCAGGYVAVKTAIKDIFTMRERVQKQQREEHVDERLDKLEKEQKKGRPQKVTAHSKEKKIQPKTTQKEVQPQKKSKWKINPFFLSRIKQRLREHDRAA